ncbi:MAG: EAL domain-containing protein [Cyanobacteria bacterium J06600_6]
MFKNKLFNNKTTKYLLFLSNVILFSLAGAVKVSAQENVLVIHSYSENNSWTKSIKQGIDEKLSANIGNVKIFHEFLDAKAHPSLHHSELFFEYIQKKYHQINLDLLMVSDDPGLTALTEQRKKYFADLPIVYLGINHVDPEILNLPNSTGIFENRHVAETIIEAAQQTQSDQIIIINDTTQTGQANLAKINECYELSGCPLDIIIINDLTSGNIQNTLKQYARSTPILLIGQIRKNNSNGELYNFIEGTKIIKSYVDNPIYGLNSQMLNQGIVGGKFLDGKHHAKQAAGIVENILRGTSVDQIDPIIKADNHWIFDAEELEKNNIKLNKLPAKSKIINQNISFYHTYKTLVWFTASAFGISLIIIMLLIEIIRRGSITKRILQENKSRYKDLAELGTNIFWEIDVNSNICYISGDTEYFYDEAPQALLGKKLRQAYKKSYAIDFPWDKFETSIHRCEPITNLVFKVAQPNHEVRIFQLNGKPIYDQNKEYLGYRGNKREITQEYNLSKTIAYQASYDVLTGLVNRRQFISHLKNTVDETLNSQTSSVLCYLDLDRFKLVNDTAGHLVGDSLLTEVTSLISNCLREEDILGRLGGDEFGLLLKDVSMADAQSICQNIIDCIGRNRFQWHNRFFDIGISIGIISILNNPFDAIELLSKADLACYRAKDLGRGRFCIAGTDNIDLNNVQMQMEYISSISQAIEQQQFYLVKQQIKSINPNDNHEHYEILLRYQDRTGKHISPGLFIPAAEKYGVITIIDRWVLETVVNNYDNYFPDQKTMISINISGISISNHDFVDFVLNLFNSSDVDPAYICFEITETAAISHISQALKFISTMKKLKVKFALDDFGSGLSSFSYLKDLPIDYLKIDGSLIENIVTESSDRAMVGAINSIAQRMNIKTIAEFVENEQISQILAEIGIDYAQGYGIHKPEKCEQRLLLPQANAS